ncbi:polysaccharide deacetylase family protein [Sporosarcina luteola]|uniref:polysaccharide deacetylase family protein n=1 Tax=Sporosarcina luteola TaxID=582850 RepID=UPI00203C0568|nr:polysaccharide deacetylase family protein [Sporosarcina luteola]MCM3709248.1 polysaccharide deacetylase [Sporosarcina luteola]
MKKWTWISLIAIICILFTGVGKANAAEKGKRYIGLHDRILPIEDIRVIDGDTKVPLKDIANYLYLPVETKDGKTIIQKQGKEFIFDHSTGTTTLDGVDQPWKPIASIDGQLFISVKYIARETGFQFEYFQEHHTIRIYRNEFNHISHEAFKEVIKAHGTKQPPVSTSNASKKATVYLTFDDGPNQSTLINNATLEKYKVPATFFFLGNQMKQNESIVKTVSKSGHYIGSHSMTHDKALVYNSTESFIAEMAGGAELVEQLTGKSANLVRVPYGSKPLVTPSMQKSLIARGFKLWDWDVDSNDWRYTDKQAGQIVKNVQEGVTKAVKSGDKDIIILLHDRSQTTIALPRIIEWLQQEGYKFKAYEPDNHIIQNFLRDPLL